MMKYIQEGTKKERNKIIWKRTYYFEEEIELLKTPKKKKKDSQKVLETQ